MAFRRDEVVNLPHLEQVVCPLQSEIAAADVGCGALEDWTDFVAAGTALTGLACAEATGAGAAGATAGWGFAGTGAGFDGGALGTLALRSSGKPCAPRNEQSKVRRMKNCVTCMINCADFMMISGRSKL